MLGSRSPGWTPVEFVTATGIVFLTVALLAPAVLRARDSARTTRCQNNLKQIGLSLHNYHDVYNLFPPGWIVKDLTSPTSPGLSWQTRVLPFLDQATVYNQIDFNATDFRHSPSKTHEKAIETVLSAFRCPEDPTPDFNPWREEYPTSNYSGNSGPRPFVRWLPGQASQYWPGQMPSTLYRVATNGFFGQNRSAQMRAITDGSSNVFAVGERGVQSAAGIWPGVTASSHENDALTDCSHASRINRSLSSYSSSHVAVNFLFGDGAVRAISPSIESLPFNEDPTQFGLYQKLSAINDGQPVGEF